MGRPTPDEKNNLGSGFRSSTPTMTPHGVEEADITHNQSQSSNMKERRKEQDNDSSEEDDSSYTGDKYKERDKGRIDTKTPNDAPMKLSGDLDLKSSTNIKKKNIATDAAASDVIAEYDGDSDVGDDGSTTADDENVQPTPMLTVKKQLSPATKQQKQPQPVSPPSALTELLDGSSSSMSSVEPVNVKQLRRQQELETLKHKKASQQLHPPSSNQLNKHSNMAITKNTITTSGSSTATSLNKSPEEEGEEGNHDDYDDWSSGSSSGGDEVLLDDDEEESDSESSSSYLDSDLESENSKSDDEGDSTIAGSSDDSLGMKGDDMKKPPPSASPTPSSKVPASPKATPLTSNRKQASSTSITTSASTRPPQNSPGPLPLTTTTITNNQGDLIDLIKNKDYKTNATNDGSIRSVATEDLIFGMGHSAASVDSDLMQLMEDTKLDKSISTHSDLDIMEMLSSSLTAGSVDELEDEDKEVSHGADDETPKERQLSQEIDTPEHQQDEQKRKSLYHEQLDMKLEQQRKREKYEEQLEAKLMQQRQANEQHVSIEDQESVVGAQEDQLQQKKAESIGHQDVDDNEDLDNDEDDEDEIAPSSFGIPPPPTSADIVEEQQGGDDYEDDYDGHDFNHDDDIYESHPSTNIALVIEEDDDEENDFDHSDEFEQRHQHHKKNESRVEPLTPSVDDDVRPSVELDAAEDDIVSEEMESFEELLSSLPTEDPEEIERQQRQQDEHDDDDDDEENGQQPLQKQILHKHDEDKKKYDPQLSPTLQGSKQVLEILLESPAEEKRQTMEDSDIMLGVWSFSLGGDEDKDEADDEAVETQRDLHSTNDKGIMMPRLSNHSAATQIADNLSPQDKKRKATKNRLKQPPAGTAKKDKKLKKKDAPVDEARKKRRTKKREGESGARESKKSSIDSGDSDVTSEPTTDGATSVARAASVGIEPLPNGEDDTTATTSTTKRKSRKRLPRKSVNKDGEEVAEKSRLRKKKKKRDETPKKRGRRADFEPKDDDDTDQEGFNDAIHKTIAVGQDGENDAPLTRSLDAPTKLNAISSSANDLERVPAQPSGIGANEPAPASPLIGWGDGNKKPVSFQGIDGFMASTRPSDLIRNSSDHSSVKEMLSPLLPQKNSVSPASKKDVRHSHSTPQKAIKGLLGMFPEKGTTKKPNSIELFQDEDSPRKTQMRRASTSSMVTELSSPGESSRNDRSDLASLVGIPRVTKSISFSSPSGSPRKSFVKASDVFPSRSSTPATPVSTARSSRKDKKSPKDAIKSKSKSPKTAKGKRGTSNTNSKSGHHKENGAAISYSKQTVVEKLSIPQLPHTKRTNTRVSVTAPSKWGNESFHGLHNETLTRLRVKRIEGQIKEMKLQSQLDIQYQREELERQKALFKAKVDKFKDPVKALSFIRLEEVKRLQEKQTQFVEEKTRLEKDIHRELTLQQDLTRESMMWENRRMELMKEISVSQDRSLRLASHIQTLHSLQTAIYTSFPTAFEEDEKEGTIEKPSAGPDL